MILKRIRRSYICRHRWRDCSKWYESKTCHESSNCFYIIAALLGIYLAANSSFWIIPVGIVCMAIGYLYTGGPIPISWTPFGELFSGLFMGMIIILLAFFIQTGNVNGFVVWISLPIVITIGLINMANNIRDRVKDKASGRKTLPILLGKSFYYVYGSNVYLSLLNRNIYCFIQIRWLIILLVSIILIPNANQSNSPF